MSILTEDQQAIARKQFRKIQETGSQRYPIVSQIESKLGGELHVEWTGAVIHRDGKPYAIQGIGRDVTERKRQEAQRQDLERQLHQAQKMEAIGTLAGGIAHDFNNILTSVIGYSQLILLNAEEGSLLEENITEVYNAGKRATDLVSQILTFARKTDRNPIPTRVQSMVKETMKMLRAAIPSSIEIKQQIESDSQVIINPTELHQIFMNLSTNAVQAMEDEGGILKVVLKNEEILKTSEEGASSLIPGSYVKIEVSDTGKGIAPENLDAIFEPYFTTKQPGEGTGLGLAVVHGIVGRCGGRISVRNKKDQGSVFTILLPAAKHFVKALVYKPISMNVMASTVRNVLDTA